MLQSPEYIIAGDEYRSSFVITNRGNTEYDINIKFKSRQNLPYILDDEKFTLAPGQSKTVAVNVKTDETMTKTLKDHFQLTAEAARNGAVEIKEKSKGSLDILPRVSGIEDKFHRIPAEMTLKYASENNRQSRSGFQTELRGKGTLDEEGTKHIEFKFRGPDIENKSVLGEQDEYFLGYWTEDYALYFGDRNYSISSLTENYLYGRGLEGKLNIDNDFSLGAYHMKTRWAEPSTEETAAYIDYLINDKNKVGINYLRKTRDNKVSNITSLEGEFAPAKDTRIELEYALGPGGDKKDNAYLTWLSGRNNLFSYYLKLTHAGPDYPGYYSDLDYIAAGLTLPVDKNLRLNAAFRREKSNLDLNPTFYSAPLEKYYQLGADYRLKTDTTFSLDWLSRDRRDRLEGPEFDYREQTLRFGIGQRFGKLNIHLSSEAGKTKNNLSDKSSDSRRYHISTRFRPDNKQSYSGYLYYDKNSDFTGENRRSTTAGLNAQYRISNKTSLNLALQTNNYQGSVFGDRDNIQLKLDHTFANKKELSLLARRTLYKNSNIKDETALMVQYTIPLNLPAAKKKSIGSIKGYVYDQQTRNAISNCLLRLNDSTAVTNDNGIFTFPSVKPGLCYLNIDMASIGANRIPNKKTPIELVVEGGKRTYVNLPVTEAARLSGQVTVCSRTTPTDSRRQNAKLVENYGLANIIVELKNSSEIKRTITDRQGQFDFEQLRPAKWTLKVYSDNLPEYHYLEQDSFELETEPGRTKQVTVRVLPKKRHIQIIAEPKTLIEEK